MKKTTWFQICWLVFVVFLFAQEKAFAARLVPLEEKMVVEAYRNGQLLSEQQQGMQANLSGPKLEVNIDFDWGFSCIPIDENPCMVSATAQAFGEYLIEPDEGEQIGDCVQLTYQYSANASASHQGDAAACVGIGGGSPVAHVSDDPLEASVEIPEAARLWVKSMEPENLFSFGPEETCVNNGTITYQKSGCVNLKIGDTVYYRLSTAGALVIADPSSSGSINPQFSFHMVLSRCPTQVPTLSEWGAIIFSLLLAAAAVWQIRRRSFLS